MRRKIILSAFVFFFSTGFAFASSLTGDYNLFDVTGLSSGDYWEGWIFDSNEDSLGDTVCGQYGSAGAKSDFAVEDVGADYGALSAGDYTFLIGAGGACGGGWDHNPSCGAGKTITDCEATFGPFPLTASYGVTITFTVEEATSTPSSTTNGTTTMTEFETLIAYWLLTITLIIVASSVAYFLTRQKK